MSVSFYAHGGIDQTDGEEDPHDALSLNWNNGNAMVMFRLLGLPTDAQGGGCTVAEARRALIRARATFARVAPGLVRPEAVEYAATRTRDGNVVELARPVRVWMSGLSEDGMMMRLEAFARFVTAAEAQGATEISWG